MADGSSSSGPGKGSFAGEALGNVFVLKATKEMVSEEDRLRKLAVVGSVSAESQVASHDITIRDVCYAVRRRFNMEITTFKVKKFHPDNFLITFNRAEDRDAVASVGEVTDSGFVIKLKPWHRRLYSRPVEYNVKVDIEIKGLPAHAWQPDTVRKILGRYCSIETMYVPDKVRPRYRVEAWTSNLESIPSDEWIGIPEPLWSDSLREVYLEIGGTPNKLSTYLLHYVVQEMSTEPDQYSDHSLDTGYGDDSDRSAKGSD